MARLSPVHPGEILALEFLEPLGISQYRLAKETGVPPRRINEIVLAKRGITADTALRLARFFGTSELFWLNLQALHDLDVQRAKLGSRLAAVRTFSGDAAVRATAGPNRAAKSTTKASAAVRRRLKRA